MESRMDSSPWADDHSSPRSPRHVLLFMSVVARGGEVLSITLG